MPTHRSPSWAKTRKPHSKKIRSIRNKAAGKSYRPSRHSDSMRLWYTLGGGPSYAPYHPSTSTVTPNRTDMLRASVNAARGGDPYDILQQTKYKDARRYAARLKKKNPKQFDIWLRTGWLSTNQRTM